MKYAMIVLVIAGAGFVFWHSTTATDQPILQCRSEVVIWESQLIKHAESLTDTNSQWQPDDVGQVDVATWLNRQQEMGGCLTLDRRRGENYARVARRIDGVLSSRFLDFVVKTGQSSQYAEWEQQEQQEQNGK
jgi:hypothetical protein